jgi:hypothetical protein
MDYLEISRNVLGEVLGRDAGNPISVEELAKYIQSQVEGEKKQANEVE